ncbi:MAG: indole-3-glycerol phosphate synthase TrpC, partial [Gemmatimonadota bacterium]
MTSLDEIVARVHEHLPSLRKRRAWFERALDDVPPVPSFHQGLKGDRLGLVAEIKRRSPSAGPIALTMDPAVHARAYAEAGADAISVLTNRPFFGGSIDDLVAVRGQVNLPVLRKDFIVDEVQLLEARAAGASAALLIVRALSPTVLAQLLAFGRACGLDLVVEVHE